jgi:CDP-glycerol glycerophosphotransferase (TagB/SpsB family)
MWSEVDVLLTANPDLLLNYPEDKKIIKFNSTYNKDIKTELSVSFIKQLNEVINKL